MDSHRAEPSWQRKPHTLPCAKPQRTCRTNSRFGLSVSAALCITLRNSQSYRPLGFLCSHSCLALVSTVVRPVSNAATNHIQLTMGFSEFTGHMCYDSAVLSRSVLVPQGWVFTVRIQRQAAPWPPLAALIGPAPAFAKPSALPRRFSRLPRPISILGAYGNDVSCTIRCGSVRLWR